ncbi:MAG: replicative DNA helicase [Acidimicrobiales bacterium]
MAADYSDDDGAARRRAPGNGDGGGRVPPHNVQAEESLLGAMLLSKDAIAAAVEIVSANEFYKPAHGHIFEAITSLFGAGEPADPVTVAEELSRAGLLEAIGGPATLVSIQANTPATTSAARYARIVEEHALLRRLIGAAGEIAEIGYGLPDDVAKAVDRAESMVFEVAQRRLTDTLSPIGSLLGANLDRLELLYERGEHITGVPTGFLDLDEILNGLQPSNLVVVGARPSMGKALALDTRIPTPTGWTTMGELAVGDEVFDEKGRPCTVTHATAVQFGHQCYRVDFDDGASIIADAAHQWFVYDYPAWKSLRERHYRHVEGYSYNPHRNLALARDQRSRIRYPRVLTTEQLLNEGCQTPGRHPRPNWYLPLALPLDTPEADLPVDPYVLGCWLGDGTTKGAAMTIGEQDVIHFIAEFEAAGYSLALRGGTSYAPTPVTGTGAWPGYRRPSRVLAGELRQVGLLGGATKHIPGAYLRASAKQRLALLQGLLDTDGSVVNGNGSVELCLANRDLLAQAHELVCTLGHKPGAIRQKKISLRNGRLAMAWRFSWTPLDQVFRLPRKAWTLEARTSSNCLGGAAPEAVRTFGRATRRTIVAVAPAPSVPVRCIAVDSPSHLYLAGESMIPTHNTSLALGMATHAALEAQRPVLVFSLEMSRLELSQRILCSEARVDSSKVRTGRLAEADWTKISHAVGRLAEAPIFIDDNPNLTVMEIRAKARRLRSKVGDLGLVVVDYIQLMTGRSKAESRQVEVSEISRSLKILARELDTPVLALAQLNRQLETRADKRPMLADLRESGSLEQDSDVVMFIYRDEVYNPETPDRGTAEILVAKHRNGPTGKARLAWLDHYTKFANMARGV